jgi:hypothetical protein
MQHRKLLEAIEWLPEGQDCQKLFQPKPPLNMQTPANSGNNTLIKNRLLIREAKCFDLIR